MQGDTTDELEAVLEYETIAVVGCSSTAGKAAHDVPRYLLERGYDVIPVNPYAEEIFGRHVYDGLGDVEESIDVVCVFRPSEEVSEIVDAALERDDVEVIWTQQGIRDDAAAARAEDDGRTVVQDRCMKVEHRRLAA
ncbi:CoA-binding protein [Natronolimnohabitans innermongolicus]|uniref:CoA-binding domain protein n=1 Tax=Natronolimnohabitans innermongolicus JCM 12255 TaxID=1227499 RepID=L9XIH4_9EURY|nr:CoA-binding protein [Natronolimnohabitans innermongolicus]ELY61221.1 CoA-binding domain protein [Natronolimnohabitans innermongolicus JCM 12255]